MDERNSSATVNMSYNVVLLFLSFITLCSSNLLIVMPIFDRPGYVCLVLQNLARSDCPFCTLLLLEDNNSIIGKADLLLWAQNFPSVEYVNYTRTDSNPTQNANQMAYYAHILFQKRSEFDTLFLLDLDMLPHLNWLNQMTTARMQIEENSVLTLYRSGAEWHRAIKCGNLTCSLPSLGNAGTVWSRPMSRRLIHFQLDIKYWDNAWSERFSKDGISFYAVKNSALLHLGAMHGSNAGSSAKELAIGFPLDSLRVLDRIRAKAYLKEKKIRRYAISFKSSL